MVDDPKIVRHKGRKSLTGYMRMKSYRRCKSVSVTSKMTVKL